MFSFVLIGFYKWRKQLVILTKLEDAKILSEHGRHRINEGLRFFRAFRVRKEKRNGFI